MSDLSKFIQSQKFKLAGGGISISSTSITLQTFSLPDGTLIDSTMLGAINYATLEPGGTKEEIISFTGVTQNIDGTATLTGVTRGLQFAYPYTADSSLALSHGGGVTFILSNNPQMYDNFANKKNDESIDGVWDFNTSPTVPTGGSGTEVANHEDLDNLSIAGAISATTTNQGIARMSYSPDTTIGTFTVTIASPAVFTKTAHGLINGDIIKFTTTGALPAGISASTNYYVISSGLTADAFQISSTIGGTAINTTGSQSGTHTLILATPVAVSITDPKMPTQSEKNAMVGTSGTPSATNPFVTDEDTRLIESYYFGDGSDGSVVFDGSTTILGMVPSSNIYTMTRDIYCVDLTINTGVTLKPSGYKIFNTGTLTMNGTATISRNGNNGTNGGTGGYSVNGSGGAGGAALAAGTLPGSLAGGNGASSTQSGGSAIPGNAPSAGASIANSLGNSGASGGAGNGTGGGGGVVSGGTATPATTRVIPGWNLQSLLDVTTSGTVTRYNNSAAATGGSSGGSLALVGMNGGGGGGAGSAGGVIAIYSKNIVIGASALISVIGGNGGNGGTGADGTGGGGGGGNGGIVFLVYNSLSNLGTIALTAGTAGTGGGTAAQAGTIGTLKSYQV